MLKAKITSIDTDSFPGRTHQPTQADIGRIVTVISVHTVTPVVLQGNVFMTPEAFERLTKPNGLRVLKAASMPESYQVLHCICSDGKPLELVAHEVDTIFS